MEANGVNPPNITIQDVDEELNHSSTDQKHPDQDKDPEIHVVAEQSEDDMSRRAKRKKQLQKLRTKKSGKYDEETKGEIGQESASEYLSQSLEMDELSNTA